MYGTRTGTESNWSHTVTHPQLRELSSHAVNEEIVDSKQTIEEKLGCEVDSFAYPYAFPQADTDFTKMLRNSLRGRLPKWRVHHGGQSESQE